ncbi:MAG: ATP-binding protein [Alphaproteobacteria bacterium]
MDRFEEPQGAQAATWQMRNREVVELGLAWLSGLLRDYIAALRDAGPRRLSGAVDKTLAGDLGEDWPIRALGRLEFAPSPPTRRARAAYEQTRAGMREALEPAQLDRVSALFQLAPFDEDVLLLALAPRLDAGFSVLFSHAHDRFEVCSPTPHLAIRLFAPRHPEAVHLAQSRFSPAAPLRRFALIQGSDASFPLLTPFCLDERMARYLVGDDVPDARIRPLLLPAKTGPCPDRHRAAIDDLVARLAASRGAAVLIGPQRSGRRAAAGQLAARFGLGLVELNPRCMPQEPEARQTFVPLLAREAALGRFAVLIDAAPDARPQDADASRLARQAAEDLLPSLDALLIVIGDERLAPSAAAAQARIEALEASDRAELWRRELGPDVADGEIEAVAEHFSLGPNEIAAVAVELGKCDSRSLWRACREAARTGLDALAERIEPHFGWDDIVLPETVLHDLRSIAAQVRHRTEVYGRGGFGRKLPRGRGITALFAGPSGVGKTMAAEVIARDLDLDLYRIDLSSVVSKYIGETEQNLRRVFDAAEASGAVLFFDEADALFGKRSEVKDSHDRYANIEVSYLLQRMESYTGLAVLATNLKGHLDPAFLRRLRFVIDVPFPDAAQRSAIWRRAFPPEMATDGLDYDALGRIEIAGGNIAVIAVNAAFLAAAERRPVTMSHIARAARAELRKLDREFKPSWAAYPDGAARDSRPRSVA